MEAFGAPAVQLLIALVSGRPGGATEGHHATSGGDVRVAPRGRRTARIGCGRRDARGARAAARVRVAGGVATSVQSLLDQLIALADIDPQVQTDPDRFRPTDWLVGDSTRLREATDWSPRIPFESILRELYEDWLERDAAS